MSIVEIMRRINQFLYDLLIATILVVGLVVAFEFVFFADDFRWTFEQWAKNNYCPCEKKQQPPK